MYAFIFLLTAYTQVLSTRYSHGARYMCNTALGWMAPLSLCGCDELTDFGVHGSFIFFSVSILAETPQLYRTKVLPWIVSQPTSRIQWVFNILEGKTQETVLHDDPDPLTGFVVRASCPLFS